jgi:hypothetical protein
MYALACIEEPDVLRLTDHDRMAEGVDAGERDVEKGEDAHRRAVDDVVLETGEVAGAGSADVQERRRAAPPCDLLGVHPDRSTTPIDVGVQVHEAGGHDPPAHVPHGRCLGGGKIGRDGRHFAVGEGDVTDVVEILSRIDHPASLEQQIVAWHGARPSRSMR